MINTEMTTAKALGALRRELTEEGFDPTEASRIVAQFVHASANDGFCVKEQGEVSA